MTTINYIFPIYLCQNLQHFQLFFSFLAGPILACLLLSEQKEKRQVKNKILVEEQSWCKNYYRWFKQLEPRWLKMKPIKLKRRIFKYIFQRIPSQRPQMEPGWVASTLHLLAHKKAFREHTSPFHRLKGKGVSWDLFYAMDSKITIKLIYRNRLGIDNMKLRKMIQL